MNALYLLLSSAVGLTLFWCMNQENFLLNFKAQRLSESVLNTKQQKEAMAELSRELAGFLAIVSLLLQPLKFEYYIRFKEGPNNCDYNAP